MWQRVNLAERRPHPQQSHHQDHRPVHWLSPATVSMVTTVSVTARDTTHVRQSVAVKLAAVRTLLYTCSLNSQRGAV